MNPAALIARAKALGVCLVAEGSNLRCKYRNGLPDPLKAELMARKPELLAYLSGFADGAVSRINSPGDLPSEWRLEWEERAAIMEFDGGLTRERAEHLALVDIIKRLKSN